MIISLKKYDIIKNMEKLFIFSEKIFLQKKN